MGTRLRVASMFEAVYDSPGPALGGCGNERVVFRDHTQEPRSVAMI